MRSSKTSEAAATSYIWDGDQLVYERTGTSIRVYVRGLNLVASVEEGAVSYYLYNAHGDVVQLADGAGNVTRECSYDSFGVELGAVQGDTNSFRYCGNTMT